MNKCFFTCARLTKDPDVRTSQSGHTIARFTIAVNREYKVAEGQPTADFLNCIAFDKTAEFVEKYLSKGSKVNIEARVQTGSYQNKEGNTVYTTDFAVDKIEFCNDKNDSVGASKPAPKEEPKKQDDFMNVPEGIAEELPFN